MCPSNGQKCASRSVEISNICESMNVSARTATVSNLVSHTV